MKFFVQFAVLFALVFAAPAFSVRLYRSGNASKAFTKLRFPQDYDPPVNGEVQPNEHKGASTFDDCNALGNSGKIWYIESGSITGNLKPVNDHGHHWSITVTQATKEDKLLEDLNKGWQRLEGGCPSTGQPSTSGQQGKPANQGKSSGKSKKKSPRGVQNL